MVKRPLILDGALGTELERQGFQARLPLWSAWALIEAPERVSTIHRAYAAAGANVLTAATFRTTRHALATEGLASRAAELTYLAVRLARDAAGAEELISPPGHKQSRPRERIRIAASLAPLEDCYRPDLAPSDEILVREHTVNARVLADASPDLILVETQNSQREAIICAKAALETELPVWVSLIPRSDTELFNGDSLYETARRVRDLGADAILVNCCPPEVAKAALQSLRDAMPDTRLGIYPNFGQPTHSIENARHSHELTPSEFASWGCDLVPFADIIGGCCGTTPEHIEALERAVRFPLGVG